MKLLNRYQLKALIGGTLEEELAPLCTACSSNSDCPRPKAPECRQSTSCPNDPKVCAKMQWCLEGEDC